MKIEIATNENILSFDDLQIGNHFIKKADNRLVIYEKTEEDKYFIVGECSRGYFKIDKEGTPELIQVEIEKIIIHKA